MSDKIDLTWNPEENDMCLKDKSKSKPEVKNKVCVEDQHLKSKNKTHKKKKLFYCDICDVITNGNPNHEQGKRHKERIDDKARQERREDDAPVKKFDAPAKEVAAPVDEVVMNKDSSDSHPGKTASQEIFSLTKVTAEAKKEYLKTMVDDAHPAALSAQVLVQPKPATILPQKEGSLVRICDICHITSSDALSHEEHLQGKKHRKMLNKALLENKRLLESRYILESQVETKLVMLEERLYNMEIKFASEYGTIMTKLAAITGTGTGTGIGIGTGTGTGTLPKQRAKKVRVQQEAKAKEAQVVQVVAAEDERSQPIGQFNCGMQELDDDLKGIETGHGTESDSVAKVLANKAVKDESSTWLDNQKEAEDAERKYNEAQERWQVSLEDLEEDTRILAWKKRFFYKLSLA